MADVVVGPSAADIVKERAAVARWDHRYRVLTVCVLAVLAVAILSAPAFGHASLVETVPAAGAALDTAPDTVVLRFNEPVSASTDGVRVYDADAERIDTGPIETGSSDEVAAGLPAQLPDGGYVVVYRVLSADSHPVGGTYAFTVGDGDAVAGEVVADLFGGAGSSWVGVVGPVLRGLAYLGVLVALGAAAFSAWIAVDRDDRDRAWTWGVRGALLAAAASMLAVPVQTVAATGRDLVAVLQPGGGLGETLAFSSFGQSTLIRLIALAAFVVAWRRLGATPTGESRHTAVLITAAVVATSFVLDGHQRSVDPTWVLAASDVVHLLGAGIWTGSLLLTASAVRRRRLDDAPSIAATLIARFSRLALWSVAALTVAGLAMSVVLVRAPRTLTSTGYGWTLLAKLALVGAVVAVAGYTRWRLVPAITARAGPAGESAAEDDLGGKRAVARASRAWTQLRTTLVVELAGVVAVAAVTGFLVSQRPAAAEAGITGAYQTTLALSDDYDIDLVVDPNRVGLNAVHVYMLDKTGRPVGEFDDLRLELTYIPQRIGPIEIEPYVVGPGHWVANIQDLRFPGRWQIRIVAGLDRFTQLEVTDEVVVNR